MLGRGGMGAVYLARQARLGNRRVAIKETVIQGSTPDDRARAVEQFQKEAEMLASLEHPNLVDVKDYFEEQGSQYLVMAFIDGATLEQLCPERADPPPVAQVVDWMIAVADVLVYMHEREPSVIVRDLKPANVMLDAQGRVRLIDFGIARVLENQSQTSTFLKGAGTLGYAPLEQHGGGTTDPRSDVYALGATMYRLLTASLPPGAVAMATGEAALTPPSIINPRVPPQVEQVVLKMMGLRKDDRYASARLAAAALREARESVTVSTRPRVSVAARFCTQCGVTLIAGATTCGQCGQPLDPSLLAGLGPAAQGPSSGGFPQSTPLGGFQQGPPSGGFQPPPPSGGFQQGPPSGGFQPPPPSGGFQQGPQSGGFQPAPPQGPPTTGANQGQPWQAPATPAWQAPAAGGPAWGAPPSHASAPSAPGPGAQPSPLPTQLAAIIGIVVLLAFGGWYWYSHQQAAEPQPGPSATTSGTPAPSPSATSTPTPTPTATPTPRPLATPTPRPKPSQIDGWNESSGINGTWTGTISGNDPQVQARLELKQSGNDVSGLLHWRSTRTGTCQRKLAGTFDPSAEEYTLHDVEVTGQSADNTRFCDIDEYVLRLNGKRLSGTYESEECSDSGTVNVERAD